jgi:DivIVA domain-containing protein
MDISPKLLREVEFREQWRGYNPEEVDDFLERLALGLEELQSRLADAL